MKTWETPKLIVLVRNNPQEAVLDSCKNFYSLSGPLAAHNVCMSTVVSESECLDRCNTPVNS